MVVQGGHWRSCWAFPLALMLAIWPLAGCGVRPSAAPAPLAVGEQAYYALQVDGRTMGYSTYAVTGRERSGQRELFRVEAQTLLKVNVAGRTQALDYRATSVVAGDWQSQHYELTIRQDGASPIQITAQRERDVWRLSSVEGSLRRDREIPLSEAAYLLDSNLFEHYAFLLRSLPLSPGTRARVWVLVPQSLAAVELQLSVAEAGQEIMSGGEPEYCLPVTLSGEQWPTMTLWMTPARALLRLELAQQNLVVERADEGVTQQVQSIDLSALMQTKSVPSNVQFSAFWNVDRLQAQVEVKVGGEKVDPAFLNDPRQTFVGTVEDGWIRGTVETHRHAPAVEQAPAYPVEVTPDPAMAAYLQPEAEIESDDPAIAAKALEVAASAGDTWQAARAIGDWVHRNIAYEITASGARSCLVNLRGDCGPQTRLVIAMCRSLHIPARMVGGLIYSAGRFGQHYWAEVYLGPAGWVPIDATAGEFGDLDATHLRLWQAGLAEELSVRVLDYEDRGSPGPLARRSLGLVPGERYVYRFSAAGKELGTHIWQVVGREAIDGREAYHVQGYLDLNPARMAAGAGRLLLHADLWVDGQGRPERYQLQAQVSGETPAVEAHFTDQGVHEEVTAHGQVVKKDLVLPEGTYLLGNNMVGWFALLYRSLELAPGGILLVSAYFSENLTNEAVHLNIASGLERITVGGQSYECLVIEVPECGQRDYVTPDGLLVRMTVPAQDVVIDLVERSPETWTVTSNRL